MVTREPSCCLTVLVLTEDSGEQAHATWELLLKKTFALLVSGVQTHRLKIDPQGERERAVTRGNLWKSTRPADQRKIVDLRRTIATRILEDSPPGFVVFHVDGDRRWSERDGAENPRRFEEIIRAPVAAIVREHLVAEGRPEDLEERLRRLVLLVPYYEIETWLYQNIEEARRRCCGAAEHLERLDRWAANRASLDEEIRPKKVALPCLEDRYNEALARGFNAQVVFAAEASYHAAVLQLLEHAPELGRALERTTQVAV